MEHEAQPVPRFIVVVNPAAGKGRAAAELVHLRQLLMRRSIEAEIFLTRHPGDAATLMNGLSMAQGTVVVAVGGDGTVHEVGTALLERNGISLGVIAVGSGNDYAALMGVPKGTAAALDAILAGRDVRWDTGMLGPYAFLNTVGFGLSASVSYESRRTGPLTGLPRYFLATARALRRHRTLGVTLDGLEASGAHRITLMEIGIGNRCGGGFRLTPRALPDDGLLDVCLVKSLPLWEVPRLAPVALRGKHLGHPRVIYEQLSSFRLRVESDTMIHVDGEIRVLPRGEHTVRVRPKTLQLRLPAEPGAEPAGPAEAATPEREAGP